MLASLQGVGTTNNKDEVAGLSIHGLLQVLEYLRRIELVDAGLHASVLTHTSIDKTLGTYLRTTNKVGQLVELLTGVNSLTLAANTTNILSLVEDSEFACTLQHIHQLHKLHVEACVGLIASVILHGVSPSHTGKRGDVNTEDGLEQMAAHALKHLQDILLLNK